MADMAMLATDPRSDYEKLNRREVIRILKAKGIQHPNFVKKTDGIKLLEANGINPREAIEWVTVYVKNESNQVIPKDVPKRTFPKRPEGHDEKVQAELERVLEAKKEAEEAKDSEIDTLKKQLADLTSMIQKMQPETAPAEAPSIEAMKMPDLKKLAKSRGLTIPVTTKKDEIIRLLKEQDSVKESD